jgi:hypothetical protein
MMPSNLTSIADNGSAPIVERKGVLAKPVAKVMTTIDQWDVMLLLGFLMLISGVFLVWGVGIALITGGSLFVIGSMWGARGASMKTGDAGELEE